MEDLRYEASTQYLSLVGESDLNEMINRTSSMANTSVPNSFANLTSEHVVNATSTNPPISQIPPKEWYIMIYSVFIIAAVILTPLSRNVCYIIYMRASKNLHNKMFSNILQAPMRFFDTNPSGKYINVG